MAANGFERNNFCEVIVVFELKFNLKLIKLVFSLYFDVSLEEKEMVRSSERFSE